MTIWVLLCILVVSSYSTKQIISISLNKIIHLPKNEYSRLNIQHELNEMDDTVFESVTTLKLEPYDRFSNEKFDIFRNKSSQQDCYLSNLQQIQYLYSRNQSCSTNCIMDVYKSFTNSYVEEFQSDSSETEIDIIIDNTLSPCHNGTYYPQVDLYQEILTTIQPNMNFFYLYKALILILVLFFMVSAIVNSIMWVKYMNVKKSLNKSLMKIKDRENLDVIYTKIKEENEVMLSEHGPEMSIREHSTSEIMMKIN